MAIAERLMAPLAQLRGKIAKPSLTMAQDGVLQARAPIVASKRPPASEPRKPLMGDLSIPCPDPTAEERARDIHQARGLKLARLDDWTRLSAEIKRTCAARQKTLGGTPVAELLAFGARSDVVGAAEHALISGRPDPKAPLLAGIEALEQVLADHPDNPVIATIVAQTHMDLGWARSKCAAKASRLRTATSTSQPVPRQAQPISMCALATMVAMIGLSGCSASTCSNASIPASKGAFGSGRPEIRACSAALTTSVRAP